VNGEKGGFCHPVGNEEKKETMPGTISLSVHSRLCVLFSITTKLSDYKGNIYNGPDLFIACMHHLLTVKGDGHIAGESRERMRGGPPDRRAF